MFQTVGDEDVPSVQSEVSHQQTEQDDESDTAGPSGGRSPYQNGIIQSGHVLDDGHSRGGESADGFERRLRECESVDHVWYASVKDGHEPYQGYRECSGCGRDLERRFEQEEQRDTERHTYRHRGHGLQHMTLVQSEEQ